MNDVDVDLVAPKFSAGLGFSHNPLVCLDVALRGWEAGQRNTSRMTRDKKQPKIIVQL